MCVISGWFLNFKGIYVNKCEKEPHIITVRVRVSEREREREREWRS